MSKFKVGDKVKSRKVFKDVYSANRGVVKSVRKVYGLRVLSIAWKGSKQVNFVPAAHLKHVKSEVRYAGLKPGAKTVLERMMERTLKEAPWGEMRPLFFELEDLVKPGWGLDDEALSEQLGMLHHDDHYRGPRGSLKRDWLALLANVAVFRRSAEERAAFEAAEPKASKVDNERVAQLEAELHVAQVKLDAVRAACKIAGLSTAVRVGNRPWMLIELVEENLDARPGSIAAAGLLPRSGDE